MEGVTDKSSVTPSRSYFIRSTPLRKQRQPVAESYPKPKSFPLIRSGVDLLCPPPNPSEPQLQLLVACRY